MDRGAWQTIVHGDAKESNTTSRLNNNNELFKLHTIPVKKVLSL